MWSRHSAKLHPLSVLAALLAITPVLAAEAQQPAPPRTPAPVEAAQLDIWFEAPAKGLALEDALAAMMRSGEIDGNVQKGFLAPLPFSADQLTEAAANFGSGTTLKVWAELYCQERADVEEEASLRGVIRYQVWVEDSATGAMTRLAKFRARAKDGDVFGESGLNLGKLRTGDTLWFQVLGDRVSPLRDVYCYFGYGIYREFTAELE